MLPRGTHEGPLAEPAGEARSNKPGTKVLTELDRPTVSVVVPTFNRPLYLRSTIASVIDQTYKNFEVIVHDNASDEDPTPIVTAFGDSRIRIYRNATNIGQTANIIAACTRATGKYIAILGDDDVWEPDFLATLVPPLESDAGVIVSFCAHGWIDEQGRLDVPFADATDRQFRYRLPEGVNSAIVRIALVSRAICVVSAAVFRREAIDWQAIPAQLVNGSDVYINYLAARTGKRCYYHRGRLSQRRFLHQSASVEATASVQSKEMTARASFLCWDTFFRDDAVSDGRRFFAMKRADNAVRIVLCVLQLRGWRMMLRELNVFLQSGAIRPSALLYHLVYGWR
jgi:glycosyltransferase involved in cell wall biosynthesis